MNWDDVAHFLMVAVPLGGLWARLENRNSKMADAVTALELKVTKDFVNKSDLEQTEQRFLSAVGEIKDDLASMRTEVLKALTDKGRI